MKIKLSDLAFSACTSVYVELLVKVRKAGSGIETADACIAAHGLGLTQVVPNPPATTVLVQ